MAENVSGSGAGLMFWGDLVRFPNPLATGQLVNLAVGEAD